MVGQFLLFDHHCMACSKLARDIEGIVDGKLVPASIHDPEMQRLLSRARPTWRMEPTLITVDDERIRVYTGMRMRLRLLPLLGLRRAGRVAWSVRQAGLPVLPHPQAAEPENVVGRRRFLQRMGAVAGGLLLSTRLAPNPARAAAASALQIDPVAAGDPVLAQLQQMGAAQEATAHFGALDWTQVRRAVPPNHVDRPLYMIPFSGAGSSVATILYLDNPTSGRFGMVATVSDISANGYTFAAHAPTGIPLSTTQFQRGQKPQTALAPALSGAGAAGVHPDIGVNPTCFFVCLFTAWAHEGYLDYCEAVCGQCLGGDPLLCVALCAGPCGIPIVDCLRQCWSWF